MQGEPGIFRQVTASSDRFFYLGRNVFLFMQAMLNATKHTKALDSPRILGKESSFSKHAQELLGAVSRTASPSATHTGAGPNNHNTKRF